MKNRRASIAPVRRPERAGHAGRVAWRGRGLVLAFSGAALLAGCQLMADSSSNAVNGLSAVDNPPLERRCGLDAVLVLDASASVRTWNNPPDGNGAVDLVAGAANAFLSAFEDTNSRVAVVSYNADPIVQLGLADVSADSLAPGGEHAVAIGDPGGETGPVPFTTGYSEHARSGGGTNWEAGLVEALTALGSARPGVPRIVVHVTDGRPTRHLDPDGGVSDVGEPTDHAAEAAEVADLLKADGVHVYAVGIGRAPEYLQELQITSGLDVFNQSNPFDFFDPVNDDVLLVSDFESLEDVLAGMAGQLCSASVTITKAASTLEAPDVYEPAEGWAFTARPAATGGFGWLLPDSADADEKTAVTNEDGRVQFQWDITSLAEWGAGTVTITETQQSGFVIQPEAACTRTGGGGSEDFTATVDTSTGAFDLQVRFGETIICTVRNRVETDDEPPPPAPAAIEVIKTASVNELPETGGPVTFTFTVSETTGNAAVTIDSFSDSVYGDLDGQGDCALPLEIPAGGSYTCAITVELTGNAGFTEVNVATASGTDEHGNPVSDSDDETVVIGDLPPDFNMCKAIEPSTIPPGGSYVTLSVFLFNDSEHPDPITVQSIVDDRFGDLLDPENPLIIDGYCRSEIAPGGSYGCVYSVFMEGGEPGAVHRDSVVVDITDDEGNLVTATYETEVTVVAGAGVSPASYWAGQESPAEGLVIGDWDGDGYCNHHWESCVELSAGQVAEILAASSADQRFTVARELLAAWLNVRVAGNELSCVEGAVNQGIAWLKERAPEGNPLAGGAPVDGGALIASGGAAVTDALTGYNTTGGGCASVRP